LNSFFQLIPRLPPPVCGVGDHAGRLATALQAQGVASVRVPYHSETDWRQVLRRSVEAGGSVTWVVHYSGYGYAKRGAPLALLRGLRQLRRECPGVRLLTMFHELYAGGPPWTSAFWLSPLQRYVAVGLARLSDAVFTNREASGEWLRARLPAAVPVTVRPVFSNFGEWADPALPEARPARLLLFGGGPPRREDFWPQVESAMERLQLRELVVVSHPLEVPAAVAARVAVRQTGVLEPEAMAAELRAARCGVLEYNPDYLGKSGVLAAYAAFGVVPMLTRGRGRLLEGLEEGRHYLAAAAVGQGADLAAVQKALRRWYEGHSLAATAVAYLECGRHSPSGAFG
jgi:hypothetical protein